VAGCSSSVRQAKAAKIIQHSNLAAAEYFDTLFGEGFISVGKVSDRPDGPVRIVEGHCDVILPVYAPVWKRRGGDTSWNLTCEVG